MKLRSSLLKNFCSAYRILIVLVGTFFLWGYNEAREMYRDVCYPDLNPELCTHTFRFYIHEPILNVYSEVLILLAILILLPTRYLRDWLLYIGSWAVPLGLWFISVTPYTPGTITWVNKPSSAALLTMKTLILITIIYTLARFGWHYWRKGR